MIRTTDPSDEDSSHVRWTSQVMPTRNPKLLRCRTEPYLPDCGRGDGAQVPGKLGTFHYVVGGGSDGDAEVIQKGITRLIRSGIAIDTGT